MLNKAFSSLYVALMVAIGLLVVTIGAAVVFHAVTRWGISSPGGTVSGVIACLGGVWWLRTVPNAALESLRSQH